ncbi:hypothetical protein [Bartonella schoenbuchensis]|uniref:hypothetical protein n=1 Tax=Bartonella schoenbuchensis TaxID=165694 RepID=UPI0031455A36
MKNLRTTKNIKLFLLICLLTGICYILFSDTAFSIPFDSQKFFNDLLKLIKKLFPVLLNHFFLLLYACLGFEFFYDLKSLVSQKPNIAEFLEEFIILIVVFGAFFALLVYSQELILVIADNFWDS